MFENLTQRERILATAVLALIPISLIFMGVFWFINAYNTNGDEELVLLERIKTENGRMLDGVKATKRKNYYNGISLPPSINSAANEYQQWLKLLLEEVQLDVSSVKPTGSRQLLARVGKPPIGNSRTLTVTATGDLEQLNEFLQRFYEVKLLHRINSLKLLPKTEGTGSKKVRNGQLGIFLVIEILSLVDGDNREEFTNELLTRNQQDYQNILKRNIFGPANNQPILRVRERSYTAGDKGAFDVEAEDADKQDLLTFELIDKSVEDAMLEQARPEDRRARFEIPGQEPGKYEFKVRVTDNGLPPKEAIESFVVTYEAEPEPEPEPEPPPPKPPFEHWTQTRVTGVARNRDGVWQAWINVRTLNQRYQLKVGDSFIIKDDERTWVVTSIAEDEVRLEAGDQQFIARPNPVDRGQIVEVPKTPVESEGGTEVNKEGAKTEEGSEAEEGAGTEGGSESEGVDDANSEQESENGAESEAAESGGGGEESGSGDESNSSESIDR